MRTRILAAASVGLLILGVDHTRVPEQQVAARIAVAGIHAYQATASRVFAASGVRCRFDPTCSHYGEAVVRRHGLVRGGWLALRRVVRCGPWTPMGTADPPPLGA